jgi:hypothetical protein
MAISDSSTYETQNGACTMGGFDVPVLVTAANSAAECKLTCTNQLGCVAADWDNECSLRIINNGTQPTYTGNGDVGK